MDRSQTKIVEEIKRIVSHNTLLAYLYFNERFEIHTDDRNFHIGAVMIQEGKPIAFYSRKPTISQKSYPVKEKDLLRIVKTLK